MSWPKLSVISGVLSSLVLTAAGVAGPAQAIEYYKPDIPVAVTGLFVVGQELGVSLPSDPDVSVQIQWSADGDVLPGKTDRNLQLTNDLAGKQIAVDVTLDTPTQEPAVYMLVPNARVLDVPFSSTSSSEIDGVQVFEPYCRAPAASGSKTPTVGWNLFYSCQTYNTSLGAPSESQFAWSVNGEWLEGESRSSLNIKPEYAGKTIAGVALVRWSNGVTFIEVKRMAGVTPERVTSGAATISGTVASGATLSAQTSGFDPSATLSYQWYSDFWPIAGATQQTLQLTADLAASRIQVLVTASREGYTTSSRISDPVGEISSVSRIPYEEVFNGYESTTTEYDIDYFTSPNIPESLLTKRKAELQKAADFWAEHYVPEGNDVMYFTQSEVTWAQDWFNTQHPGVGTNIQREIDTYGCPYAVASRLSGYLFHQCANTERLDGVEDNQVTPHEYTHWVQYSRTSGNWLPATRWLIEGQANFYGLALGLANEDDDLQLVNRQLAGHSLSFNNYVGAEWGELVMLDMLASGDITDISTHLSRPQSAKDSYVLGTLLSEWLVLKFGHDKYWQWVSGILDGKNATDDFGAALTAELTESIFGIEWKDFPEAAVPYLAMRAAELRAEWQDLISPDLPPDPPGNVQAVAGDRQVSVSWSTPNDFGSPILGYRVRWEESNLECPSSPCVVTGLINGREYDFKVVAFNAHGNSQLSAPSNRVRPAGQPKAPTRLTVRSVAAKRAQVTWGGASSNGAGLTRYEISWKAVKSQSFSLWRNAGVKTSFAISGLAKGKRYQVRVRIITPKGIAVSKTVAFTQTK